MANALTLEQIMARIALSQDHFLRTLEAMIGNPDPQFQRQLTKYIEYVKNPDYELFMSQFLAQYVAVSLQVAFEEQ